MNTRFAAMASLFLLSAACGPSPALSTTVPTSDPAPTPPLPTPTPAPLPTASPPAADGCSGASPRTGYVCVRNCGPPVSSESDPPPGYSWMTAADAERRREHGCPVCLPGETRIATPDGERAVASLHAGDEIWTLDRAGERVSGHVLHAGSTVFVGPHHVLRIALADGRSVVASPGHPTFFGSRLDELEPGDALSGSIVLRTERTPMAGNRTFDLLPSGTTGAYWADGVVLRSSFWR